MASDAYSVDSHGRILSIDSSIFAPDAWKDAASFEVALAEAGKVAIGLCTMGSRKEPWIGDLVQKQLLDIEEGASLVTGINCSRGRMPFLWGEITFYPVRPNFGALVIASGFAEKPLNKIERALYSAIFEHRVAIWSLSLAIKHGNPQRNDVRPFDWWLTFWAKRGVPIRKAHGFHMGEAPTLEANDENGRHASHSGAPGRPSSMHLIEAEFLRRVEHGQGAANQTVTAIAIDLVEWLKNAHPQASRPTPKTVRNKLSADWRKKARTMCPK